jgi:hypothetical protein
MSNYRRADITFPVHAVVWGALLKAISGVRATLSFTIDAWVL